MTPSLQGGTMLDYHLTFSTLFYSMLSYLLYHKGQKEGNQIPDSLAARVLEDLGSVERCTWGDLEGGKTAEAILGD